MSKPPGDKALAAAILYADHRESSDHDHVVADLADRFEMVLEALSRRRSALCVPPGSSTASLRSASQSQKNKREDVQ